MYQDLSGIKDFTTRKDLAKYLNTSSSNIDRLIAKGEFVAIKIGSRTIISMNSVHDFINRHTLTPKNQTMVNGERK